LLADRDRACEQDGDEQAAEPNAYQKRRNAVDALQSRLDVRRSGVSHVIDIFVETREPQKSAEIANAIAKAYEQEQIEARATAARPAEPETAPDDDALVDAVTELVNGYLLRAS